MDRREYQRKYREEHREHTRELGRRWAEKHREELRKRWRERYQEDRDKYNEKRRRQKEKVKTEVLTYYGNGKCACVNCGENHLPCLSIDHIGGGGNAHRRELAGGKQPRKGDFFYQWLKNNDFPEGYQTLCMNCQFLDAYRRKYPSP